MIYDQIIIWWWASGLFCAINSPKNNTKLILEKQDQLWTKILLSGWGRCNFSNINISPDRYFGENKKMLPSIFHKFDNNDMQEFLEENNIETQIEDNGRIILKSWKAQQLLDSLISKVKENNTEIKLNQNIINIHKTSPISLQERGIEGEVNFIISTELEEFKCKKLIIATWWVSFPQTWTTWYGLSLAEQFNLEIVKPYAALCGIETEQDLSDLSWSSIKAEIKLFNNSKTIYQESWNLLFTHRWLSGPIIFNTTAAIWEYLSKKWKYNIEYIKTNTHIEINISNNDITKRLKQSDLLWDIIDGNYYKIHLNIKNITDIKTAKVSWWWISMSEIKPNFESKKIQNLYFIWETLDITGQTGWFNLQRAWSSGFVCWKNI